MQGKGSESLNAIFFFGGNPNKASNNTDTWWCGYDGKSQRDRRTVVGPGAVTMLPWLWIKD